MAGSCSAEQANDHPFVLVVAPPAVMSMEPRVLRSRTHLSSSGPVLSVKICDEERGRELAITDPEDPDLQQQIDHFVRPGAAQGGRGRAGTRAGGAGGGGGGGGAAPKYAYTKLQDLTEANKHYDVYAVVARWVRGRPRLPEWVGLVVYVVCQGSRDAVSD